MEEAKTRTIAVTGATGFIGKHVVRLLKEETGWHVVSVGRNKEKLQALGTDYVVCDINEHDSRWYEVLEYPDVLLHLAWEGLPNYQELFHIERNLPVSYRFLKAMVQQGLPHLTVAGTCQEYGLQNGCLTEHVPTHPTTCYGIAKDSLRRFLEALRRHHPFHMQWARLFYIHGDGQNLQSLLAQLTRAMDRGERVFKMSKGEQLRDYLPVEAAARRLVRLVENPSCDGIVNICSGRPVSIRRLAEEHIAKRDASIRLDLGHYPYPDYEPMAFWGNDEKLVQHLK